MTTMHDAMNTAGITAPVRAVPSFDAGTGRLVAVTLTRRPPRTGASVGTLTPRPDLDAMIMTWRGFHWHEHKGDLVCRFAPTETDILEQVADDIAQGRISIYCQRFADEPCDERLRETATERMGLPAEEAEWACWWLTRQCAEHEQRLREDEDSGRA